jgi:uncharacterized damage-inducible protein DinB
MACTRGFLANNESGKDWIKGDEIKNSAGADYGMQEVLLQMWKMGRMRLTNLIPNITEESLKLKIKDSPNSIGWYLRHIAEIELLFSKNVFELPIQVKAFTLGAEGGDKGKFTDWQELKDLLRHSESTLQKAIEKYKGSDWSEKVTTLEFGTITRAEALSRVISHTAYHSGQIAIALKYGA